MLQKIPIPDKIVEALLCDFNKVSHLATYSAYPFDPSSFPIKGISLRGTTTNVEETAATKRAAQKLKKNYTNRTLMLIQKPFYQLQKTLLIH